MPSNKYSEVFSMIEHSFEMQTEALHLQRKALSKLIELSAHATESTERLINALLSPEMGEVYSAEKVAKILGVSRATVYNWVQSGKIPHTKPNRGKVIFYKHQLTEFFKQYHNEHI